MNDLTSELLKSKLARVAVSLLLIWAILVLAYQLLKIAQGIIAPLQGVLVPLLVGFAIAYLLDPLADRLERHMPRGAAVAIISAGGLLVVLIALAVVIPIFVNQAIALYHAFPGYVETIRTHLKPWTEDFKTEYSDYYEQGMQNVRDFLAGIQWSRVLAPAVRTGGNVLATLGAAIAWTLGLLIIPVIAIYLLNDIDTIKAWLASAIPPRWRGRVLDVARQIDEVMGRFVRGFIAVSLCLCILYSAGLAIVGVPMWLFVGVTAGVLYAIPYLGTMIGMGLALILALAQFGMSPLHIVGVLAVFAVGQFIESWFLTPRLLGKEVGLHPVVVILAVILGGQLFGIVGMFLALPATAVIRVLAGEGMRELRASSLYQEDADASTA